MSELKLVTKNGEILFLYDAKMCNPNGDPDDENRPRMDLERERNLVSDVRLKRYIRDYLYDYFQTNGGDQTIYVTKAEGVVQAGDRVKQLLGKDSVSKADLPVLLTKLIDARLFGATIPLKEAKEPVSVTGPVQFNWGYSLNRVQLVESNTLSSQFAAKEQAVQGTFGKDYRLYYSLIAFHGIVSARRAAVMYKVAGENPAASLNTQDLELLDQAMLKAIPLLAIRSKIGQYPGSTSVLSSPMRRPSWGICVRICAWSATLGFAPSRTSGWRSAGLGNVFLELRIALVGSFFGRTVNLSPLWTVFARTAVPGWPVFSAKSE